MRTTYLFLLIVMGLLSCAPQKGVVDSRGSQQSHLDEVAQRQFDYYFHQAVSLKENGDYDQALETLELCLKLDPQNADAHAQIAGLYAYIGFVDKGLKHFEIAVDLQPTNWWYNFRYIGQLSNVKQYGKAIDRLLALKSIYPYREEVYTSLSTLYKFNNEFSKAISALNDLEKWNGIDEDISLEKASLYFQMKMDKKGIAEIEKLSAKFPNEMRYQILRGDIFLQQNQPQKAFAIYQKVLNTDPQNAHVYLSLSNYYDAIKQPEKAIEAIASALKSEELDVETKMQVLGQYVEKTLNDSLRLQESESMFKLLIERYPLEEQVLDYYVSFLKYNKRDKEAIAVLETMTLLNPSNDNTWINLLSIYIENKNYSEALKIGDTALEQLPNAATLYYFKALAQYKLNDAKGGIATVKKAIALMPADKPDLTASFYAQLAEMSYSIDDYEGSFAAWEDAIRLNPKDLYAMNNYAYYLSLQMKDLKRAEKLSAKTVEIEPNNATFLDTYAWILYQQKRYTLAKFYIERAIDNIPEKDEKGVILDHYGDILWMLKDDAKALEMWNKSLKDGLDSTELKQKIQDKGFKRE